MTTTRKTLETLLAQSGSLPQGASPDNIVELGEILWGISSKSARSFLKNAAAVISCFTREDVTESELLGGGRVLWMEPLEPPHPAKPRAAPDRPVLSSGWRQHLNGWFEQGKRLSLRRPDTGVEYFASTALVFFGLL